MNSVLFVTLASWYDKFLDFQQIYMLVEPKITSGYILVYLFHHFYHEIEYGEIRTGERACLIPNVSCHVSNLLMWHPEDGRLFYMNNI